MIILGYLVACALLPHCIGIEPNLILEPMLAFSLVIPLVQKVTNCMICLLSLVSFLGMLSLGSLYFLLNIGHPNLCLPFFPSIILHFPLSQWFQMIRKFMYHWFLHNFPFHYLLMTLLFHLMSFLIWFILIKLLLMLIK